MAAFDARTGQAPLAIRRHRSRLGGHLPEQHARRDCRCSATSPPNAPSRRSHAGCLAVRRRLDLCHAGHRPEAAPAHLRHRQPVAPDGRCLAPRRQPLHLVARRARSSHRPDGLALPAGAARSLGLRRGQLSGAARRDGAAASAMPAVAQASKTGWVYVHRPPRRHAALQVRGLRAAAQPLHPAAAGRRRRDRARHRRRRQLVAVGVRPEAGSCSSSVRCTCPHATSRTRCARPTAASSSTPARRTPTRPGAR